MERKYLFFNWGKKRKRGRGEPPITKRLPFPRKKKKGGLGDYNLKILVPNFPFPEERGGGGKIYTDAWKKIAYY